MNNKIHCLITFAFFLNYAAIAQVAGWIKNDPFGQNVFIENKGQFDTSLPKDEMQKQGIAGDGKNKIHYYANSKGVDVYFSLDGLTYSHDEFKELVSEEAKSKLEQHGNREPEKIPEIKHRYLQIEWVAVNPFATIEANELQSFYYTYPNENDNGKSTFKANCYKKLIYRNLYPNIDVEYILPENGGVKYSLILHHGADLSQVKMRYINAKGLSSDSEGNITIRSEFGDFVDHAPISFYATKGISEEETNIPSVFDLKGNTVSFILMPSNSQPQTTNGQQPTIIIDPWTSNPAFPVNKAYDVNYDLAGNVYICGSGSTLTPYALRAYMLAKYNSSGVLQWVFTTNIGPALGTTSYGDFAVDEVSGTTYLMGTWAAAIKVNTLGIQTGGFSPGAFPLGFELWRCEYNRCLNRIVVGCGGTNLPFQAGMLDTSLTTFTPVNSYSAAGPLHDIALLSIDPTNSTCYMATARSAADPTNVDNMMLKLPVPNLIPPIWGPVSDGYTFVEIASVTYTPWASGTGICSNGFNGMACGTRFLYTYDGSILKKWNKNTGAFIAQVATGGTMFATGGLSVDKCDNVYAGSGNVIKEYNSSLVLISTYPVPNSCYDVKLGPNNKLYACGAAFVSQIDVPALAPPTATSTPTSGCNACNGTATALPCGDPTGYNYLWNPGGQVTQTATGLCPGTYTVSISYACTNVDIVTVSVIGGSGGISLNSIQTNACSNTGSATLMCSGGTMPYTYLWSNGQTSSGLTGLSAGIYTVTATDANGCSAFKIINILNNINVSYTSKYSGCLGGNSGSIILNVSGGSLPYTYAWNIGQTGGTATSLSAGTYTVTVTDANGCMQTLVSTLYPYIPITIQTDQTVACTPTAQAYVVSMTGGTPLYNYSWSNAQSGPTATGLSVGTYTVTVTDANGCKVSKSVTITNGPNPANATFTQSPAGIVCAGATVNFTSTGSSGNLVSHTWTIPGQGPIVSGSTTNFTSYLSNLSFSFASAGTYTVTHTVTYPIGGCTDTRTSTITVVNCTGPIATATGNSVCPATCAMVTSGASGGSGPYIYSWSNGATTQNINPCPVSTTTYTVTIKDFGGNTATSTAVVTVNPAVSVTTTSTNITCNGSTNGSAIANPGGGTPVYVYSWSNGSTTSQISGLTSQIYTVTITDVKGCTSTAAAVIMSPPPLTGQFTKGTANCAACGCKEWLMVTGSGGTSPYSYSWSASGGIANRYRNQLCPGSYTINITDKNGCSVNVNLSTP